MYFSMSFAASITESRVNGGQLEMSSMMKTKTRMTKRKRRKRRRWGKEKKD
jgi:hypothetical protein